MTRDEMRALPIERCAFDYSPEYIHSRMRVAGILTLGDLIDAGYERMTRDVSCGTSCMYSVNRFLSGIGERKKVPPRDAPQRSGTLTAAQIRAMLDGKEESP